MTHGKNGDAKGTGRRGVPVRTSGRTTFCFVLLWLTKGPNVASCWAELSRKAQKRNPLSRNTWMQAAQIPNLKDCLQQKWSLMCAQDSTAFIPILGAGVWVSRVAWHLHSLVLTSLAARRQHVHKNPDACIILKVLSRDPETYGDWQWVRDLSWQQRQKPHQKHLRKSAQSESALVESAWVNLSPQAQSVLLEAAVAENTWRLIPCGLLLPWLSRGKKWSEKTKGRRICTTNFGHHEPQITKLQSPTVSAAQALKVYSLC